MLVLISPAKRLDYETPLPTQEHTQPELMTHTERLAKGLKKLSAGEVGELMSLSVPLSNLNYVRFQNFSVPLTARNARPAIFAFKGDVYEQMDVLNYSEDDLSFAQGHLRMLSGLYGLLRPLDLMQPYRLEMGTKFNNERGKNLYQFWGDHITNKINEVVGEETIINLASQEYFKSVNKKSLKGDLITISHKQYKSGQLKSIGLMAKRGRGLMADYIIKNKITNPRDLMNFTEGGYSFKPEMSTEDNWVFTLNMDK